MKYQIEIKPTATCPAKDTVIELCNRKATSFKTAIGETKKMGRYPVYVDTVEPANMYGRIENVMDADNQKLTPDEIDSLVATKPEIHIDMVVTVGSSMLFKGTIVVDESKNNNIDNTYISERLSAIMQEKIAQGVVSEDDMKARLEYMQENHVAEPIMYRTIKGYRKYNKAVHRPRTIYVDPFLKKNSNAEGVVAEGLRCSVQRMPTICEGEKSVGKNVYMETLAWIMGMPLYMIGFSRNMNPNAIYGEKSTDNSASENLRNMQSNAIAKVMLETNQQFQSPESKNMAVKAAAEFELNKAMAASVSIITDASELYDWMTDGGCMVWNEMNMAESNFFSSFANPLTDGTGFLFFPGRGEVKMHKDCVLFGTQNADYEGVMQQNEATMSRFNILHFEQPRSVIGQFKAATNAALKADDCDFNLPEKYYVTAEKFYQKCMDAVHSGTVSNSILNIRGFVRALTTVAESECTCTLARWIEICVVDACPADEQQALKDILRSVVVI